MKPSNPFTLTFGKQPSTFISRERTVSEIIEMFDSDNPVAQTFLIEGVRGCGKTVLMTTVAQQINNDNDDKWIVVNLNPNRDLLEDFAARLQSKVFSMPNLLEQGFNVSILQVGVGLNGKDLKEDSISRLEKMFRQVAKKNKKILITIDEVLPNNNMRIFTSQFQIFLRENYPLYLLMTGLYENIYALQNDPALTFLLRSPKIKLEPLSKLSIIHRYEEIFRIHENDALRLADITKGYAFAFQALGAVYWNYQNVDSSIDVIKRLDEMLDDFVYRKIWASLSAREHEIVLAIQGEKRKTKDICEAIEMSANTFTKYRNELVKKGILVSDQHGVVSLALPRFYEIVRIYDKYETE